MKEMNDKELHEILKSWEAPAAPPSLKESILYQYRKRQKRDWRWFLTGSMRVPVPVVSLASVAIIGLAIAVLMNRSQPPLPPPPPQIVTRIVEVPVVQERVVTRTVYRDRTVSVPPRGINLREFQPVASLVPRIIKKGQNDNQN
jgi:hypothetical protein